jgi:receptor protein-tyrosine kinase
MNVDFLKSVFDNFRTEFDYILVDTPPCGLVSDTVLITETVDAIIYVVLQDTVRINRVLGGIDSVNSSEARIIGAVMNGAQSGFAGYGENYGYSYGYGKYKSYSRYGYGYGYGYEYPDKKNKSKKD